MGCTTDTLPGRCQHPVVRGQVKGMVLYRDCDNYPCGPCGEDDIFVCGEGVQSCARCARMADALCDFPLGDGKTCDLPLCAHHRIRQGGEMQDIDFCPQHALIAQRLCSAEEGRGQEGRPMIDSVDSPARMTRAIDAAITQKQNA